VGDPCDNCPDHPNPDQADVNADGIGDVCGIGYAFRGGPGPGCDACSVVAAPSASGGLAALLLLGLNRRRRRPRRSRLPR